MINYFWEFVIFEVIPFYFFFSHTLHLSCSFPSLHSSKSFLPTSPLPQIHSFSIPLQKRAGLFLCVQMCVYTWHCVPVQRRDNLTSWSSPITPFSSFTARVWLSGLWASGDPLASISYLPVQCRDYRCQYYHIEFHIHFKDSNSGPHACTANCLSMGSCLCPV